jgi:ABC-2 type transport system ATP-binding protein
MIEIRNLTKRYGATLAVDDLSFTVRPGQVTGFLGPNGAGKTTTMRVALGLAAPTAGDALITGRRYRDLRRPLGEVGALLDADAVDGTRSAFDHLRWLARSHRIADSRVESLLDEVGLASVARRPIRTFSLGMRQRLGIAAALLGDPGVLLFDEPVNGLDPAGVKWIRDLFRSLAGEGRTVFVSSHLMSEMAITADRLIIVGRGHLIADTTVAELATRFAGGVEVRAARATELTAALKGVGADVEIDGADRLLVSGIDSAAVGRTAQDAGIPLIELVQRQASLEDAYLDLTGSDTEYRAGPTRSPDA